MVKAAKRKFVDERHSRKVYPMSTGPKKGRWKTYVYVNGKRKEIAGKTEDDVYESLYKHYSSLEESPKTLSDVFELLKDRKQNELARSEKTIREDVRLFNHLSETLRNKDLVEITESDIRKWLVKEYLPNKPTDISSFMNCHTLKTNVVILTMGDSFRSSLSCERFWTMRMLFQENRNTSSMIRRGILYKQTPTSRIFVADVKD